MSNIIPAEGSYDYDDGTSVTVTAYPASGSVLLYWKLDGVQKPATASITVLMNADHALEATFQASTTPPATFNFGNQTIESAMTEHNDNGYVNMQRYQAPYSGTIQSLQLYTSKSLGTPFVKGVVYADSNGVPAALLGEGTSIAITNTVDAWVKLTGLNVPITAGAYYWIGNFCGDQVGDQINEKYAATGTNSGWNAVPTTWTYPTCKNPFGVAVVGYKPFSLYAECVSLTTTFTLTVNSTPTGIPFTILEVNI
jgi:hypothetical protein